MRRVGVLIPGGAAAYPSTLLMTICPAQAAGVRELAVVMPPTPAGAYNQDLLAVCHELGVTEVYRVGGAQAVAALAYGVEGLPAVDMIVGPGNMFVALAKRYVYGQVAIDCIAGTERGGGAGRRIRPAALRRRRPHRPGRTFARDRVSWSRGTRRCSTRWRKRWRRSWPAVARRTGRESLEQFGAFVLARDEDEAVKCVNQLAPEHCTSRRPTPRRWASASTTPERSSSAITRRWRWAITRRGRRMCLPTGGTARFTSGLSANDFLRRSSVLSFTKDGLAQIAGDVCFLAEREGLPGHALSVEVRMR